MAFGVWGVLRQASATRPVTFGIYVVGAAVVHDAVIAPVVCLIGWFVTRRTGAASRPAIRFGLILTGATVLFSIPFIAGWGRLSDNPSLLPGNYALGLMIILAGVWVATGVLLLRASRTSPASGSAPPASGSAVPASDQPTSDPPPSPRRSP